MSTLFQKYGGFATISKIVMDFYDRLLDSEIAGPFFDDIAMPRLIDHQAKLIAQVMGGPAAYSNEVLRRVHAPYSIDRQAFNEVAGILNATLQDHGVEAEDIGFIMAEIEARSPFVISTS